MVSYGYNHILQGDLSVDVKSLEVLKTIVIPVIALPCLVAIYAIKQMTVPTDGTEFMIFAAAMFGLAGYSANEIRNYFKIRTIKKEHDDCLDELKKGGSNNG